MSRTTASRSRKRGSEAQERKNKSSSSRSSTGVRRKKGAAQHDKTRASRQKTRLTTSSTRQSSIASAQRCVYLYVEPTDTENVCIRRCPNAISPSGLFCTQHDDELFQQTTAETGGDRNEAVVVLHVPTLTVEVARHLARRMGRSLQVMRFEHGLPQVMYQVSASGQSSGRKEGGNSNVDLHAQIRTCYSFSFRFIDSFRSCRITASANRIVSPTNTVCSYVFALLFHRFRCRQDTQDLTSTDLMPMMIAQMKQDLISGAETA